MVCGFERSGRLLFVYTENTTLRCAAMADDDKIISYATPAARLPASGYEISSIVVASINLVWYFTPFGFDPDKHDLISTAAWFLGLVLAVAAYRQPYRSRTTAHIGAAMSAAMLVIMVMMPTA